MNHDECQCECKEHFLLLTYYMWNPNTFDCEYNNYICMYVYIICMYVYIIYIYIYVYMYIYNIYI